MHALKNKYIRFQKHIYLLSKTYNFILSFKTIYKSHDTVYYYYPNIKGTSIAHVHNFQSLKWNDSKAQYFISLQHVTHALL